MNGLYCAIDCSVFIWDEMSDVEPVAISFNNSLIAVNLTVSPGSGSNVCSRKLHRKINRGFFNGTNKLGEELKMKNLRSWRTEGLLSCGGKTRTYDLWVMSPTSYHCSTPRYSRYHFLIASAKVYITFQTSKHFQEIFSICLRTPFAIGQWSLVKQQFDTRNSRSYQNRMVHINADGFSTIVSPPANSASGQAYDEWPRFPRC